MHISTLIEALKSINPNIKIAFILLPRYESVEKVESEIELMGQWKEMMSP